MIYERGGSIEVLYEGIKRLAWQILPDRAEDLAQDVAFKLWSNRSSLPVRFHGCYLRRVVANAAYDILRKERKHMMRIGYLSVNDNGSISTSSEPQKQFYVSEPTTDYLEGRERLTVVCEAMQKLSLEQKEVIALRAEGWSCVAEKQAVSVATVRTRIHYARKKLEQAMGDSNNE